ncbi:hypothetical protein Dimus_007946, partial [Dionaea muscipula]
MAGYSKISKPVTSPSSMNDLLLSSWKLRIGGTRRAAGARCSTRVAAGGRASPFAKLVDVHGHARRVRYPWSVSETGSLSDALPDPRGSIGRVCRDMRMERKDGPDDTRPKSIRKWAEPDGEFGIYPL